MLDLHRASDNQLKIEKRLTCIYNDILKPVDSMLYRRGSNYEVIIDCPQTLVVETDSLRLKQVMLNLARNSSKFVESGFVKLSATVVDGNVRLSVSDSGKGIPIEKRARLFEKFQQSLDSLQQGTGIGLSLCKSLITIMGGDIWLDEAYDSGVVGNPGACFVVDLKIAPATMDFDELRDEEAARNFAELERSFNLMELPQHLNVLFVDDDLIIRKLFCRSIKKVSPAWTVSEASSGEMALQLARDTEFDLIFLDQYMASVDKQLLGSETCRELRARGVGAKICGLSANDLEVAFLNAGASGFMIKPFPAQKELLELELKRILFRSRSTPFAREKEETGTAGETESSRQDPSLSQKEKPYLHI